MKDMGKVMAALKERYAGQMDFAQSERRRQRLALARPNEAVTKHTHQVFRPGSDSRTRFG